MADISILKINERENVDRPNLREEMSNERTISKFGNFWNFDNFPN